jgi:sulfate transport system permease protein
MVGSVAARPRRLTEPSAVRLLLTGICLAFLALFLVLPLVVVFVEAFRNGVGPYVQSIREPDAVAAVKLTLIAAAFAVPANLISPPAGRSPSSGSPAARCSPR